ncbi:hypothetical protein VNO77_02722 [Canavalia gladiata]|uniref:Uncharacterized protein n=1 Tax=Canavalia gladiata TaxID=3824 RepID=A0AAN9N000_CANGL
MIYDSFYHLCSRESPELRQLVLGYWCNVTSYGGVLTCGPLGILSQRQYREHAFTIRCALLLLYSSELLLPEYHAYREGTLMLSLKLSAASTLSLASLRDGMRCSIAKLAARGLVHACVKRITLLNGRDIIDLDFLRELYGWQSKVSFPVWVTQWVLVGSTQLRLSFSTYLLMGIL